MRNSKTHHNLFVVTYFPFSSHLLVKLHSPVFRKEGPKIKSRAILRDDHEEMRILWGWQMALIATQQQNKVT
ncbi:hypothetical protein Lal_00019147 [Lupinus albus]|nr:hypothetical protein Lal_00019147 [Lupinus albus]